MTDQVSDVGLLRTVDWKQGLSIAMGVPLLILPSIGYFTGYVGVFSIAIWLLSVVQGFFQNIAYGELATMFPDASGLPGYAQKVLQSDHQTYGIGNFFGGFSAWSYWFAWCPVLAIFSLLIGGYLKQLIPGLNALPDIGVALVVGALVFSFLLLVNYRGLRQGAYLSYVLAAFSLAPLLIIALVCIFKGEFHFSNLLTHALPSGFRFDLKHVLIVIGLFAMAQWSACAWETAAVYGPEYKNPEKDIIKSLFVCGTLCLFTFTGIQLVCVGVLGVDGIVAQPTLPILILAERIFGPVGVYVSILSLITSMILIIQTAFLGSARAMHSMATEGNLPRIFSQTNAHGVPVFAMGVIIVMNLFFMVLKNPSSIVAASSIGYVFANAISLYAFVRTRFGRKFAHQARIFKAPAVWKYFALFFMLVNFPLYIIGIVYLNSIDLGWRSTLIGFAVLGMYVPLWGLTKKHLSGAAQAACPTKA